MSSPSSARIHASSSKVRSSKRDVNPSASRSRVFGASSVSNSSRVVNGTAGGGGGAGGGRAARVYLDGTDVTPQSLLMSRIKPSSSHDQRAPAKGKSRTRTGRQAGGSVMGASVILSQDHFSTSSIDDSDSDAPPPTNQKNSTTTTSNTNQTAKPPANAKAPPGAGVPVAGAAGGGATAAPSTGPEDDESGADGVDSAVDSAPKMLADITQTPSIANALLGSMANITGAAHHPTAAAKPEKKVRRPVTIVMLETPTEMLFELRSVCVAQDATNHQAIAARNRQYVEVCAAKKGSDKFVEGRSQTLQLAQKTKEVMTAPPATRDSACAATDWDIFDCMHVDDDNANDHDDNMAMETAAATAAATSAAAGSGGGGATAAGSGAGAGGGGGGEKSKTPGDPNEIGEAVLKQQVHAIVDATMSSPGCVLDVDGDIVDDLRARQHALRHSRKHRHGHASSQNNSQKSRVFHHSSGAPSQEYGRSSMNVGNNSSSSMASPSQSSGNVSFGASQDVTGGLGGGEDSGASNSVANSQIGLSGGASRVLSNGSDGGKQNQNAYARANTNVDLGEIIAQQRTAKVLASESLFKTVSVIERAVQQNVYHHQHVLYRNFPVLSASASSSSSALSLASGSASESFRKDKFGGDSDWRSSIGLSSDPVASGAASSSLVPPIGSFNTAAGTGPGSTLGGRMRDKYALEKLWSFQCSLTEGRTVTCLAWNTVNEDLLAVAYARAAARPECPSIAAIGGGAGASNATAAATATATAADSTSPDDGLVLFWSLKNPEFPERVYNLDIGVTSIDFSRSQPYMLAVGFMNGVVAIYDTRKDDAQPNPDKHPLHAKPTDGGTTTTQSRPPSAASAVAGEIPGAANAVRRHVPIPVATSETSHGKHLDAVWQVKWISKGSDRGENVVTISSDGRVTEWSMKKGLSFSDLMTLKRVANPLLGSDARADGGVISRQASGHCIDFATQDPSVYYVGTEDGIIHKCSVSYNEQYLQTYYGHTGPVYQILVSPFSPDLFLSCSADWNVKLWHQSDQHEALNFRSVNLQHAVLGISWCPSDATIFGTVTEDGRIEIWDLQHSSLDPIITHYPKQYATPSAQRVNKAANGGAAGGAAGASSSGAGVFDPLDDLSGAPKDGSQAGDAATIQKQLCEVPMECTKIAFAPSAPVIVVGDSTGNVTVYRVPALTDRASEPLSVDDHIARLFRAMHPNKQE